MVTEVELEWTVDEELVSDVSSPGIDDPTLAEQDEVVEEVEHVHGGLVHRRHHRAVVVHKLTEHLEHHGYLVQGDPGGGLIHDQQLRPVHKLLRDRQSLALTLVEKLHLLARNPIMTYNAW